MQKKTLAALVTAVASGGACAQSSIQLFGVVDAGLAYYRTSADAPLGGGRVKQHQWALINSGIAASRLGLRGREDLGGGLEAGFWLEAPINNDDGRGSLSFERRSTVSISGRFGEVRLGRDHTPTAWNDVLFDPFDTSGAGTSAISQVNDISRLANFSHFRVSNSLGYFLPSVLGGLYGQLMYAFGENGATAFGASASKNSAGRYAGGRMGYGKGPWDIAAAYGQSTVIDTADLNYKIKTTNVGASYDFNTVKLMGELSRVRADFKFPSIAFPPYHDQYDSWLLGAAVPVGSGLVRVAYSAVKYKDGLPVSSGSAPRVRKWVLGYTHYLSRRTALYATAAYVRNKNDPLYSGDVGPAAIVPGSSPGFAGIETGLIPRSATGYEFGIRVVF
jgi:predicted porin